LKYFIFDKMYNDLKILEHFEINKNTINFIGGIFQYLGNYFFINEFEIFYTYFGIFENLNILNNNNFEFY